LGIGNWEEKEQKEMTDRVKLQDVVNRRTFLESSAHGLGLAALSSLLPGMESAAATSPGNAPKAKRVI
jgi:hypothetical protein